MPKQNTKLRIFVSSPSDVVKERDRLRAVVIELNRTLGKDVGMSLELLQPQSQSGNRPQESFSKLVLDSELFLCFFWSRFGAPTGATHKDTDQPYASGTEEEFDIALDSYKKNTRPRIFLYRCMRDVPMKQVDTEQLDRVLEFWKECQHDGKHPSTYGEYNTLKSFGDRVKSDLQEFLLEESGGYRWGRRQTKLERRNTTILVSMIKAVDGFSKEINKISLEQATLFTNRFFQITREAFRPIQTKGEINSFFGNGFLVFLDECSRCGVVELAIRLQKQFKLLINTYKQDDHTLKQLTLSIGITWGEMIYGPFGSPTQGDITGVGPPVDLAFKLSRQATGGQICVTPEIYQEAQTTYKWDEITVGSYTVYSHTV